MMAKRFSIHVMFRFLCILSWTACLLVLGLQAVMSLGSDGWEWITLMDFARFAEVDLIALATQLSLTWFVKLLYLLQSVKLAEALWWLGAGSCAAWAVTGAFSSRR